MHNIIFK